MLNIIVCTSWPDLPSLPVGPGRPVGPGGPTVPCVDKTGMVNGVSTHAIRVFQAIPSPLDLRVQSLPLSLSPPLDHVDP